MSERAKKVAKRGKAGCSSSRIGEIARHHSLFPSRNEKEKVSLGKRGERSRFTHVALSLAQADLPQMAAMYSVVNAQTAEKESKTCDRPLLAYFLPGSRLERR